ncbi:unnamed protein product [Protopolystoma xenopodis]|uniref:Secreted protein n=1 Tax=Protopolystoma xenopodis TaxID=117903 RepID=A0A3S5FCP7_9PLAT|nr:unnamed protein product [Protopolystoma xenopodis]
MVSKYLQLLTLLLGIPKSLNRASFGTSAQSALPSQRNGCLANGCAALLDSSYRELDEPSTQAWQRSSSGSSTPTSRTLASSRPGVCCIPVPLCQVIRPLGCTDKPRKMGGKRKSPRSVVCLQASRACTDMGTCNRLSSLVA